LFGYEKKEIAAKPVQQKMRLFAGNYSTAIRLGACSGAA
jgi:hypothetical protein